MNNYDKEAFLAGYKSAFDMRGIKPSIPVLPYCRYISFDKDFKFIRHGEYSYTIQWKTKGAEPQYPWSAQRQGIIFIPDLFPITITAATTEETLIWGYNCPYDMDYDTLNSRLYVGSGIHYSEGIPNNTKIVDLPDYPHYPPYYAVNTYNLNCVFCVDRGVVPDSIITLLVQIGK